ncbi:MAG TPA: tetratricopeptide repeat protein [Candidatus Limnocylindria bacterium]|jgi:tetratricopeptide (TPR) repeat protein
MPRTTLPTQTTEHDSALAHQIGARIRDARKRSGMTQQQLAGERYTKAYVSALETGIARPSMVALSYLAERLSLPASHFLDEQNPTWSRLAVDMTLAAGDWEAAANGYASLLDLPLDELGRAEVLRGRAEALARLDRGKDAVTAAAEAARIFGSLGRISDEALARYWLAYGLYLSDQEADAHSLLSSLLERVRAGLKVEPDFEMRLLMALAAVASRGGDYARSLTFLETARGLAEDLDDRRRAMFLFNLAISYQESGDLEAAIRTGTQGLALLRSAGTVFESAQIENTLALAYLSSGNIERAAELADEARAAFEAAGDDRFLSAVLDTDAQVALAQGRLADATATARRAIEMARATGNRGVELTSMLTEARALRADGDLATAESRYEGAADLARRGHSAGRTREVLREWAELRAERGDHRGAYELTSEALAVK